MKHSELLRYKYLLPGCFLLFTGCVDNDFPRTPEPLSPDVGITFILQVPQSHRTTTRALSADKESEISRMAILTFTDNNGTQELAQYYDVSATGIVRDQSQLRFYTITIPIQWGTYSSILLLANVSDLLTSSPYAPLLTPGTPRTEIEKITLQLPDATGWNADDTYPDLIPMWGEVPTGTQGITIGKNMAPITGVKMIRMLARINLLNHSTHFDPQEIYLFHFRRNGLLIPDTEAPALPTGPLPYTQPLLYGVEANQIYVFEQEASDGKEYSEKPLLVVGGTYDHSGEITYYRIDFVNRLNDDTPQAENQFLPLLRNYAYTVVINSVLGPGYKTPEDAAICLPFNTVVEIFTFDEGEISNILFDGKYYLAISHEIMEFGKDPATQILHIETDNPLGWELATTGGDSWLSIDRTTPAPGDDGNITVSVAAYDNAAQPRQAGIHITAGRLDYEVKVQQSYLSTISLDITDMEGNPISEILFRSNPFNTHLTLEERRFQVNWQGPGCEIHVGMLGNRLFDLPTGLAEGEVLQPGQEQHTFTITPGAFIPSEVMPGTGNPFMELGATVTFVVSNGEHSVSRTLHIRHQCISIVFDDLETLCFMGHEYRFGVRSNTTWRISKAETDLTGLFKTVAGQDYTSVENMTDGNDITTGTRFTMRIDPPSYNAAYENWGIGRAGRKLKLTFSDEAGICPDITQTFIAILPDPNCYRVKNGGGTVTPLPGDGKEGRGGYVDIPIRKLFWMWEKELDRELEPDALASSNRLSLSPVVEWQTKDGLVQQGASRFTLIDRGGNNDYRDYVLRLYSEETTSNGNALVSIRNNNTEILWSYHIWVTNYFPDHNAGTTFINPHTGAEFMNYNLGATLYYGQFNPHLGGPAPAVSPELVGLYYQWGRKDPFPGPAASLSPGSHSLQTAANQLYVVRPGGGRVLIQFTPVSVLNNLANSIRNPTTHYMPSGPLEDWYSNGTSRSDQHDYLWRDKQDRKGLYDPCPAGWCIYHYSNYDDNDFTGMDNHVRWDATSRGSWVDMSNGHFYLPAGGTIGGYESTPDRIESYKILGALSGNLAELHSAGIAGWNEYFSINVAFSRSSAINIRCKRDTYDWYTSHY